MKLTTLSTVYFHNTSREVVGIFLQDAQDASAGKVLVQLLKVCVWRVSDCLAQHFQQLQGAASSAVRRAQQVVVAEASLQVVLWVARGGCQEEGQVYELISRGLV